MRGALTCQEYLTSSPEGRGGISKLLSNCNSAFNLKKLNADSRFEIWMDKKTHRSQKF